MNQVEIELSKKKMVFALIGSLIFIILGIQFIVNPEKFVSPVFRSSEFILIAGICASLMFSYIAIIISKKLFDKKIGLIINQNGIVDNTSGMEIGLIEWNDITAIRIGQVKSTKFLLIDTDQPEKYLKKVNSFKARMMKLNTSMYGTPLSISSNSLKCNFDELENAVRMGFEKSKMPNS